MKKILSKILLVVMSITAICSVFTGCGSDRRSSDGKTVVKFLAAMGEGETSIYNTIVENFNKTNKDNIKVVASTIPINSYSSSLSTALSSGNQDVVNVTDKLFKMYANNGYMQPLDDYISSSTINVNDLYGSAIARYRYDKTEMTYNGANAKYYAIPKLMNPTVMFYNKTYFDIAGIDIISIAEEELDAYNVANGKEYLPHGYYEYPANYSDSSLAGKKVFNNQIALNWEETVKLSNYFTKGKSEYCLEGTKYNCTYGYYTEWWFSYCWSIGGDCLEYDKEQSKNVFTLGDKTPNYLVTKPVTIDGKNYTAGTVLDYDAKMFVEKNKSSFSTQLSDNTLYKLPSQYEGFAEFLKLPKRTENDGYIDTAKQFASYGISPNPTTMSTEGKGGYFSKGEIAMLVVESATAYSIATAMQNNGFEWDVAPVTQYREYNSDGTLKTVNGTEVVGEKAGFSSVYGWAIPSKSPVKNEAFKFIEYLSSAEVQKLLMNTGLGVPVLKSLQADYKQLNKLEVPMNKLSLIDASEYETVGDWAYLEDGDWVDTWSSELNTNLRNGKITIETFFNNVTSEVEKQLERDYRVKKSNLVW